jgi:aldos-2-ulose dehydratase
MDPSPGSLTSISATRLNKEVLIRVPRPQSVPGGVIPILPTLSFAAKKLSVVVLPPRIKMTLDPRDGVKVIYGRYP